MPRTAAASAASVRSGGGFRASQLEHHVAAQAHDPGADLDQLVAQRGQRPMLDPLRQGQCAQEVGEVVGERVQLEAYGTACRQPDGSWERAS